MPPISKSNLGGLKITTVGDGVVGKTCMLTTYTTGEFPEEYVPTVFEHYGQDIVVDGEKSEVTLWDTAGQEDFERLRTLVYPGTHCFLICFSVEKANASYDNVLLKWVPEIKHFCKNTPFILVGTKNDLRDDPSVLCHTFKDGKQLAKKVRAWGYMECSALRNQGLEEIFQEAIRVHRKHITKKSSDCECVIV